MPAPALLAAAAVLQLTLVSPSRIGQPLVYELAGSIAPPGPADSLLLDTIAIPGGVPLGLHGTIYVGAGPAFLTLPGDGTHRWTVPVPALPGLVGVNIFAQALGLMAPGGIEDLRLSNLVVSTLEENTPSFPEFAFTADALEGSLSCLHVDASTGVLRQRSYVHLGGEPRATAVHPSNPWIYAVDTGAKKVHQVSVSASSGKLSLLGSSDTGLAPGSLCIEDSGRFLYVGNAGSNNISQYAIDGATGALTPLLPPIVPAGSRVTKLVVHPSGSHLYAIGGAVGSAVRFQIDASSGRLFPLGPVDLPDGPTDLVFNPAGTLAYATGVGPELVAYTVDGATGALASFAAPVLPAGTQPTSLVVAPGGSHLYVADAAQGTVLQFRLGTTGIPNALQPPSVPCPGGPSQLLVDPSGTVLVALVPAASEVRTYAIHAANGTLSPLASTRTRGPAFGLALSSAAAPRVPRSPHVYLALEGAAEVRGFQLDSAAGLLSPLASVADTAPGPVAIALHPSAPFGLSANFTGQSLTRLSVDALTGAVAALGSPAANAGAPFDVEFERSGRFAYAALFGGAAVQPYAIDGLTGQTTALTPAPASPGSFPRGLAVDPTGRFVYVAESFSAAVRAYRIDAVDGLLAPVGLSAAGNGTVDVAVDPSGRYAYALNNTAGTVQGFRIDATSGALLPFADAPLAVGSAPFQIAITPDGRYLYTANSGSANLSIFEIEPTTGGLTSRGTFGVVADPRNLVVDAGGRWLVVSNRAANLLQVLAVDPLTGALSGQQQIAAGGAQPRGLAVRDVLE